jgi:hypothetical protein
MWLVQDDDDFGQLWPTQSENRLMQILSDVFGILVTSRDMQLLQRRGELVFCVDEWYGTAESRIASLQEQNVDAKVVEE